MNLDNIDVFGIEAQKKKMSAEQRRIRQKEINDIIEILELPAGRRFIWNLWSECGIFRNPFNPNSNQHSFASGRMSIGQELLADVMEARVSAFAQMQNEYMSAQKSKQEAKEA